MKKFETGDVVKVISTECASCGSVGIVKKITDNKVRPYTVMFLDAESEYSEDELEKVCDGKPSNGKESRKTLPVNTIKKMVQGARAKALKSAPLRKALMNWFKLKGNCPYPEITDFGKWVEELLYHIGDMIKEEKNVTIDNLVAGLKVNAIGDPLAVKCSAELEKKNIQTDINCYVEEGKVYSSVWIKHMVLDYVNEKAEEVAGKFREKGYSVDMWVDEEDASEITVNAWIDFDKYVENQKKGGR